MGDVKNRNYFSYEERKQIERLFVLEKKRRKEISKILGRSLSSITGEILRGGGDNYNAEIRHKVVSDAIKLSYSKNRRRPPDILSNEQIERIKTLINSGYSQRSISLEVGCSEFFVRNMIKKISLSKPQDLTDIHEKIESIETQIEVIFEILKEIKNDSQGTL